MCDAFVAGAIGILPSEFRERGCSPAAVSPCALIGHSSAARLSCKMMSQVLVQRNAEEVVTCLSPGPTRALHKSDMMYYLGDGALT